MHCFRSGYRFGSSGIFSFFPQSISHTQPGCELNDMSANGGASLVYRMFIFGTKIMLYHSLCIFVMQSLTLWVLDARSCRCEHTNQFHKLGIQLINIILHPNARHTGRCYILCMSRKMGYDVLTPNILFRPKYSASLLAASSVSLRNTAVMTSVHHCFPLQEVPPPPQHARPPRRAHHLSILRQHLWPLRDGQCPHTDVAIWFHRD